MVSTRPKILYLITKSNWGGAQRYVYDLATRLPDSDFDVAVAAGGSGELIERLHTAGIRTISIQSLTRDISARRDLSSFFEILSILRREQPNVFHINSSKAGGLGALAGRLYNGTQLLRAKPRTRIIFTAHAWAFNENRPFIERIVIAFLHWITILLSHKTIAITRAIAREMESLPFIQSRISVIRHGVTQDSPLSKEEARAVLFSKHDSLSAANPNAVWIGTIAELIPVKGIDVALHAAAKVRDSEEIVWCFIGDGTDRMRYESLRDELTLQGTCFFLGHIADAKKVLPAFDVCVLPSRSEALGYALLEAGQASLPVIASNVGGIPEVISAPEYGILIPPNDPEALSKAIKDLAQNRTLRTEMGARFQKHVKDSFGIDRMIRETIALY